MTELCAKGVTLEDYDMPGLKTESGVVQFDGMRGAWLKDSEDYNSARGSCGATRPVQRQVRFAAGGG